MICPNLSIKEIRQEFDELKSVLGEDMAYLIWNRNNGYHLDKANNGKPSKLFNDLLGLTDRKGAIEIKAKTLSNSFKQWFGESKVVDENGEPLVVYHGTNNTFSEFKVTGSNDSVGRYGAMFGSLAAAELRKSMFKEGTIMPTFLKLINPKEFGNLQVFNEINYDNVFEGSARESWKKMGFDGLIIDYRNSKADLDVMRRVKIYDYLGDEYVVFEPNQIKSIFNTGVFNRYSDNIYDNDIIAQKENRQQTQINGSMSQEIVSNFETYFPDYAYLNGEQREVIAGLVEQGKIQLTCTI